MRPFVALIAVLAAAAIVWLLQQSGGGAEPTPAPLPVEGPSGTGTQALQQAGRSDPGAARAPMSTAGGAVDAAAAAVAAAAAPGFTVRVVAADSGEPIAGARARFARDGGVAGTSDANGVLRANGARRAEVVFDAAGFLLAMAPPTPAVAPKAAAGIGEPLLVRLEPDRYTIPRRLQFVAPADGSAADVQRVRFRIVCRHEQPPSGGTLPRERLHPGEPIDPELHEAWQRHAMLSAMPAFADRLQHFGVDSGLRVFESGADVVVRFVATGPYEVEALAGKLVGRQQFVVTFDDRPVVVRLGEGVTARGVVADAATGAPVPDAEVLALEAPIGVAAATTDASGAFTLGPLSGPVTLTASHPLYERTNLGPLLPREPLRVTLQPKPVRVVEGVVRARPQLQPIAGARVALRAVGMPASEAVTTADGRFVVRAAGEDLELVVEAAGYVRYVELLAPETQASTFDLLPASAEARLRAGLTAIVSGRVLAAGGEPCEGMPVQLQTDVAAVLTGQGIPGRHVVEGGVLASAPVQLTDAAGGFTLECAIAGPARLVVAGGERRDDGHAVEIVLGRRIDGLTLRAR